MDTMENNSTVIEDEPSSIVKYSGREAEGVRGNSREQSSPEFDTDAFTLDIIETHNEQINNELYDEPTISTDNPSTYMSGFQRLFTKYTPNNTKLKIPMKKTLKKNKNDPNPSSLQEHIQHKRELMSIHQMLSVSHIHTPATRKNPHHHGSSEVITIQPTQISPKIELILEFLWCFPCCYYLKNVGCIQRVLQNRTFENTTQTCQVNIYDTVHYLVYAPLFDNEQIRPSNLQKMALFIRFCFELYKTMIGSYLTVFTPQDCNGVVCTLQQNLIPRDTLEIAALTMNSFMAFSLLCEYVIEIAREKILRMYFENDQRLPVEKEYFTNLLGILDTKKASLLGEKSKMITLVFHLYRKVGIILLSLYVVNVSISGIVIYKNYYDKSSLFGFVTNALFIVLKMVSILKIAIHSINMPYSAYIETPVAFNSLKPEYIKGNVKKHFLFGLQAPQNEHIQYFEENKQYIRFLLNDYSKDNTNIGLDIEEIPTLRHRKSFG